MLFTLKPCLSMQSKEAISKTSPGRGPAGRTSGQRAQDHKGRVGDVQLGREPPGHHARQAVDGQQVDNERVAAP